MFVKSNSSDSIIFYDRLLKAKRRILDERAKDVGLAGTELYIQNDFEHRRKSPAYNYGSGSKVGLYLKSSKSQLLLRGRIDYPVESVSPSGRSILLSLVETDHGSGEMTRADFIFTFYSKKAAKEFFRIYSLYVPIHVDRTLRIPNKSFEELKSCACEMQSSDRQDERKINGALTEICNNKINDNHNNKRQKKEVTKSQNSKCKSSIIKLEDSSRKNNNKNVITIDDENNQFKSKKKTIITIDDDDDSIISDSEITVVCNNEGMNRKY